MAIIGIITDEGVLKSIDLQNEEGFKIVPYKFAVTEEFGVLSPSRSMADTLTTWYEGLISAATRISHNTIQLSCNIPAAVAPEPRYTKEIYVYAKDQNNNDFLLGLAHPTSELTYDPEGELRIRIQFTLTNVNIGDLYQFVYTQATEINDHNEDHNAHPVIKQAMNKAGIYAFPAENKFNGQMFDGFPVKAISVNHMDVVYWNTTNNRYEQALANTGDEREQAVGIYLADLNIVVHRGIIDYPHSLSPNDPIYLSTSIVGQPTASFSNVVIGRAMPNSRMMVDFEKTTSGTTDANFDGDFTVDLTPPVVRELTLKDDNGVLWDVIVSDEGLLSTVPYSARLADPTFRIPKIDFSFAQLRVKTDGELIVVSPPVDAGAQLDEFYYLQSPNGICWKLTVNLSNEIVMQSHRNSFLIKSENYINHFAVQQQNPNQSLTYLQVIPQGELPATPVEVLGLLPFTFYNNGTGVFPVYYDGSNWKYIYNNTVIP